MRILRDIQFAKGLLTLTLVLLMFSAGSMLILVADMQKVPVEYVPPTPGTSGFLPQTIVGLNMESADNPVELQQELANWRIVNKDVRGIINISEWGINYPVLYSENNKEYLRKDINGNYDVAGCIYLDANYGNTYSPMKLIHGHNMKNGTMFGKLPSLLHEETLDTAPIIEYYDELGLKQFKIFSVYSVNAQEESVIISEYTSLSDLLESKENYTERSWVPVSEVPNSAEMLMLNTCWYGESGSEHFLHCIVVACRIK